MAEKSGFMSAGRTFRRGRWGGNYPVLLLLALALVSLLLIWHTVNVNHEQNLRNEFESDVEHATELITARIRNHEQILRSTASFLIATGSVSLDQWRRYVANLDYSGMLLGVQGLGYAVALTPDQLPHLEQRARNEGMSDFHVWPAGERAYYSAILYLEPADSRNRHALGYDMYAEPVRREAMDRACSTGDIAGTGQVTLVQEISGPVQSGFLLYLPVYAGGVTPATEAKRKAALRGWIYSPFRVGDLISTTLQDQLRGIRLEIFQGVQGREPVSVYDTGSSAIRGRGILPKADLVQEKPLYLYGTRWTLRYSTYPHFAPYLRQDPFWVQLAAITTIALLLIGLTGNYIGRQRAAGLALELSHSLQASEERLRAIFYKAPVGIVLIDAVNLSFAEFNDTACTMLGYSRTELSRSSLIDIQARLSPIQVRHRIHQVLEGQAAPAFENRHRRRDGEQRYVLVFNSPLRLDGRNFILAVWQDITERKQAEAERAELADLNRKIIFESTQGVMVFHADGRCVLANDAACRIFDSSREHLLASNFRRQDIWRRCGLLATALEALALNRRCYRECSDTTESGREIWVVGDIVPFQRDGEAHLLLLLSDVTEFRKAEQTLRIAKDLADEANQAKSEFLANMSHEIRTPMNTILGMGQLLQRSSLSGEQQGMVRSMLIAGAAMLSVINDILEYSRIEAGRLVLDRAPFNLSWLLDTAAAIVEPQAQDKGLKFHVEALQQDWTVLGDRRRLEQVLVNLLGNAVKFTEHGSVELHNDVRPLEKGQIEIRLSVMDTGIGIAQDKLESIFGAFEQADASTTRRFGGTGLGLSISRRLIEAMGGNLTVDSHPGLGSVFTVVLPLDVHEHQVLAQAAALPGLEQGTRLAGVHVLVVDDSRMNQDVARRILESEGAVVETADNGSIAVGRLRRAPQEFQVVLMDLHMPIMDGFEATEHIRQIPELDNIPVIAVSAGVLPEQVEKAKAAGVCDFLGKPYDMETMVSVLCRLCGHAVAPIVSPSEAALTPSNLPDIPGIARNEVTLRLGNDRALFLSLLQRLGTEFADLGPRLHQALAEGQDGAAVGLLHKLKGSAANLGANTLADLADQAETALRQGRALTEYLPPLLQAYSTLVTAAEGFRDEFSHLSAGGDDEPSPPHDDLQAFLVALEQRNLSALTLFPALRPWLESRFGITQCRPLEEAMARLDFAAARDWFVQCGAIV